MKLQFSLATLLVCMTVLAVVCAIAACVKVHAMAEWEPVTVAGRPLFQWSEFDRAPNVSESWESFDLGQPFRCRHARRALDHPPLEISPPY